ncbi:hypothetical protein Tco_0556486 [Tanacetum coccineum]
MVQVMGLGLRYALTKNPTIYASLIEMFWQTAAVRTIDNGDQEITAQLMAKNSLLLKYLQKRVKVQDIPLNPNHHLLLLNLLMKNQFPNVVSSSHQKTQTPRQALNKKGGGKGYHYAASLGAEQASGNINRTQSTAIPNVPLPQGIGSGGSPRCQEAMGGSIAQTRSERVPTQPYDSPLPRVNTLGSDEGSMTLLELTVLCTTLSKKVESLEAELEKQRRNMKLIKMQGVALVTPTHSQEDQPEDQLGVFSAAKVLADAAKENVHTYTRRRRAVGRISTAEESVNTAGASMPVVIKDKGKAKMDESEPEQTKTKLQQRQERVGYEAAVRLKEQLDEEERKRISRVPSKKLVLRSYVVVLNVS